MVHSVLREVRSSNLLVLIEGVQFTQISMAMAVTLSPCLSSCSTGYSLGFGGVIECVLLTEEVIFS